MKEYSISFYCKDEPHYQDFLQYMNMKGELQGNYEEFVVYEKHITTIIQEIGRRIEKKYRKICYWFVSIVFAIYTTLTVIQIYNTI